MMKPGLVVVVVLLSQAVLLGGTSAADPHDDERSATFVGTAPLVKHDLNQHCADAIGEDECFMTIYQGIMFVTCDGEGGHPWTGGLYDGIGAVKFCDVPPWSEVELEFDRLIGAPWAYGLVLCSYTYQFTKFQEIGRLTGDEPLSMELPSICGWDAGVDQGDPGSDFSWGDTDIIVVMAAADTVDPGVPAGVEGEIIFRMLREGPG